MTQLTSELRDALRDQVQEAAAQDDPVLRSLREETLGEAYVELAGVESAARRMREDHLVADVTNVLAADLAARVRVGSPVAAARRAVAVLPAVLTADAFERMMGLIERTLPVGVQGRLAEPADAVRRDVAALRSVYVAEWHGLPLTEAGAGGDEFVCRIGRLCACSSLVADAHDAPDDEQELAVTLARRYAWRWLRTPVPEAARPAHRRRTAALLSRLVPHTEHMR